MLKSKLFLSIIFFIMIGCFGGCKKQNDAEGSAILSKDLMALSKGAKGIGFIENFTDFPTLKDGMLYFRDAAHISSYLDFLDAAIVRTESQVSDRESQDPDDILEGIEAQIGFTSLRHTSSAAFEKLNEQGWSNVSDIPEKHFISDISIKSILNEKADVQVGEKITHFINRDYAATIKEKDIDRLKDLHNLSEDAVLTDILNLDPAGQIITLQLLSQADLLVSASQRGTGFPFNITTPVFTIGNCSEPKDIQVNGLALLGYNFPFTRLSAAEFQISWGDGTVNNYYTSNNAPYINYARHTYSVAGRYTIRVVARSTSPATGAPYDADGTFIIDIINSCNYGAQNIKTVYRYDNNNMNRCMKCTEWVLQWRSVFGIDKHKIGAQTESYLFESNKWKESRIDEISAEFSTIKFGEDCTTSWGDSRATYNGNSKSATAINVNQGQIGWTKVFCKHRMRVGSYVFVYEGVLTPCN